jgi:DeoR/GlpR family transcriptional regulator of sugar metabolism
MTKEQRHETIMEELIKHGSVLVTDLVRLLDVSAVTVRKDLTELEKGDKLYRSHGKAVLVNPYINNRPVNEKEKLATDEKHAIGREAARLITRNDSICIASGTTVHALARNIVPIHKLTVVSASLPVSNILSAHENIDIYQLGGLMRHSSLSVVGEYAARFMAECSFSKLYLGVDGIDIDYGITTTEIREATLNKMMIAAAQKTIVLADSSKFGRRGFAKIADIDAVDVIITDAGISPKMIKKIEDLGIELIIAG